MTRSPAKILANCFLLWIIILFHACKESKNKQNQVDTEITAKFPQIEGFFIFKRDMSFMDVSKLLTEKKINFRIVNLEKRDEINYPLVWRYLISASDLSNFKNTKIMEGFNLPILNKNLNRFQIGFFNDTLFYFRYENILEAKRIPDSNDKVNYKFTKEVKDDIALLEVLSEGLTHKYGYPQVDHGSLNAFYPSTSPFGQWDDYTHNGTQYSEWKAWITRDSSFHIHLENNCIRDSSKMAPYEIKTQSITEIEVLFNAKYAEEIKKFINKKYELEEKARKSQDDSLIIQRYKQFDSL